MIFEETGVPGLLLIHPEQHRDDRGTFARTFCTREFGERGLVTEFVQHSLSRSYRRHTLRGLHFQRPPHAETKLVSCASGALWDVAVDLRAGSATRGRWFAAELTPENGRQLYIPAGFAHGFITLEDETTTRYLISNFYEPAAASGLRFDDPDVAIDWPAGPQCIAEKDLGWPGLADLAT
jgi:dTDP-4-dehydrorhamnose 3,5-epimerase